MTTANPTPDEIERALASLRDDTLDQTVDNTDENPRAEDLLRNFRGFSAESTVNQAVDALLAGDAKSLTPARRQHLLDLVDQKLAARRAERTGLQLLLRSKRHAANKTLVDLAGQIRDLASQTDASVGDLQADKLSDIESGVTPARDETATTVLALWARIEQMPRDTARNAYRLALQVSTEREVQAAAGNESRPFVIRTDNPHIQRFTSVFDAEIHPAK